MGNTRRSRRSFVKTGLVAGGAVLITQSPPFTMAQPENANKATPTSLTLSEASELLRTKKISPLELTQACLRRIEKLNYKLNAFIAVAAESALAEARAAEVDIQQGRWKGPLHGIPIALKDLVDVAGMPTTAASALFKDRVATEDADIVRRLKAAGAVFLGKLNMHELAYGGSSVISYFGPVRNPWQPEYCTGGSSGGSAAAVAAQLCYGAIGSDTGGSIRQPSGYCGIVGLKPTYGRVSTRGAIPLSWTLDHLGPMTRTVRDAALMLHAIAGYDSADPASRALAVPDYVGGLATATSSFRLGIPRGFFYEALHPEVEAAIETALATLRKLTAGQRDLGLMGSGDSYAWVPDEYTSVIRAETYAYHEQYVAKNPELYQPETLRRIRAGADVATTAYVRARRRVEQARRSISDLFDAVDLLITPTSPVPPFTISELQSDPSSLRPKELLMLRNTRPINALGLPTISVPCGLTRAGLPIGLQISGAPDAEAEVLQLAYAYEQATEWHKRRPAI